jgi:ATP-binding cassette, subfamily B, putative efflux pump
MSDSDEKKKKKIRPADAWREAKGLVWARRWRLALGLALMLASRLAGMVLPASSKYLIDNVITKGNARLLPLLALAAGVATLIQAGTSFGLSQLLGVTAQRSITEMRRRVQQHVTRLSTSFFDSTKSGVLISRIMTDAEGIRNLVGTGLVNLVGSLVTAVFALGVLFYLNWRLTTITLVVLAAFAGIMALFFRRLRPLFRERGAINAEVTGRLGEALGGIRVVKVYTAEKREDKVFAHGAHRLLRNVALSITSVSGVGALSTVILGAVGVVMLWVGGNAVIAKTMSLGELVMYLLFTGMLVAPMVQISSTATQLSEAFAGLDRIRELLARPTEAADDDERDRLPAVRGDVAFEDVSFAYQPGTPVLRGVSFRAPAGSTTALVGSSGSGKSTLIGLVTAFHRPDSGRILVDGHDLAGIRLHDYRSHLGVVLQDNFLFDGTIAENIRYGKPHAADAEVVEAARIAHCEEFISGFDQGYDTVIGERGVKLSGGQRQRIAIARAILADPAILILDEATSSLDSESEGLIQEALARLRSGRTTFVIAHRLSTIQSADQILVIEGGEIVERGTHRELLARGGRYRELYDKQVRLETNLFINPGEDPTTAAAREAAAAAGDPELNGTEQEKARLPPARLPGWDRRRPAKGCHRPGGVARLRRAGWAGGEEGACSAKNSPTSWWRARGRWGCSWPCGSPSGG